MNFEFYNPDKLVSILKSFGINKYSHEVCPGCVFSSVSPESCFHKEEDFEAPSVQSDNLCAHCFDTAEEFKEPFRFSEDSYFDKKMAELEEILKMASI